MGPQLDSCGRPAQEAQGGREVLLQWGRNLIVAEGLIRDYLWEKRYKLQWGRNLIVAEGSCKTESHEGPASFNGAAT